MLPRGDSAEGYVGRWFKAVLLGLFMLLAVLAFGMPKAAVGPLPWLNTPIAGAAGWTLLAGAMIWVILAQAQMGASWRIGIDAAAPSPLVTSGVFGVSRNPIFPGMRASLLGLFLVLPNACTLVILVGGEILMQVQVRLEEAFLTSAYPVDYSRYSSAVRRWV